MAVMRTLGTLKTSLGLQKESPLSRMLPFNVGFFAFYGCSGYIAYILPLYLKQLGMTPNQIGIISCTRTVGALFGGTLFTVLHNKLAKLKNVMTTIWTLNVVVVFLLVMIRPSLREGCVEDLKIGSDEDSYFSDRSWMFREDSTVYVFVAVNLLVFCADALSLTILTSLQGGCMQQLGKGNTALYGRVRAWGALSQGIGLLTVGAAVSGTITRDKVCRHLFEGADYHLIVYLYACFGLLGILNSGYIPDEPPHKNDVSPDDDVTPNDDVTPKVNSSTNETPSGVCSLTPVVWLVVNFCWSTFSSVYCGFFSWHLENLGASPSLLGFLNGSLVCSQYVGHLLTPKLIEVFGHTRIVCVGLLFHVSRFVAFGLVSNPMILLPLVAVGGLVSASTWSATASFLSTQVSEGNQKKMQGVLINVHTMGKAAGYLISGGVTQAIGAPNMFLLFAGVSGFALGVLALPHILARKSV